MKLLLPTLLLPILAILAQPGMARSAEPLVFASSFASGDQAGIHAFAFNGETGQLTARKRTTGMQHPFFLAISPCGRFLYAIDAEKFGGADDEFVAAYAIEGREGALRPLNRQSARGTASCYLEIDATGKTVLVANYSSGSVAALPVNEDGSLAPATSVQQHHGSSVDPSRQKGPFAHCVAISPDNRFALAADLGIDQILIYALDPATARLAPSQAQPFAVLPPGSGPRHLAFPPNGQRVYVVNELANTLTVFDYHAPNGTLTARQTLSTLPPGFHGRSHTADVKITPDGQHLYATNRGHDSLASYRIAPDGSLSLLTIQPSGGKGPQNLLISPDGRWLLCANMPGNNLAVFRIDPATGALAPNGSPVEMAMPSCLRWLD